MGCVLVPRPASADVKPTATAPALVLVWAESMREKYVHLPRVALWDDGSKTYPAHRPRIWRKQRSPQSPHSRTPPSVRIATPVKVRSEPGQRVMASRYWEKVEWEHESGIGAAHDGEDAA